MLMFPCSCSGLGRGAGAGARRLHSISACVTLQETETAGDSSRGHLQVNIALTL